MHNGRSASVSEVVERALESLSGVVIEDEGSPLRYYHNSNHGT